MGEIPRPPHLPRVVTAGGAFRRGGDVRPPSAALPLPPRKLARLKPEAGEEERTSQASRRGTACQGTPDGMGPDGRDRVRVVATNTDNSFPERLKIPEHLANESVESVLGDSHSSGCP